MNSNRADKRARDSWQDTVAPIDEELLDSPDLDALLRDVGDLAAMVVECTVAPLRGLVQDLPRTFAFERSSRRRWRRSHRDWQFPG
jgi:hypothetical protein